MLLADPPGAGKTAQAIVAARELGANRVLVVCPASLRLNWVREWQTWCGKGAYTLWPVLSAADMPALNFWGKSVIVVSYDLAARAEVLRVLSSMEWDLMVLDEAHFLKSRKSLRSVACYQHLWPKARKVIAITGTPLPNGRASEAHPLFSALCPELFKDWWRFAARYCVREETPWGMKFQKSKNLKELGRLARERFMIRRSKEEVLSDLPPLVRQTVPLTLSDTKAGKVARESMAHADEALKAMEEGGLTFSPHVATARRELGVLKVPGAASFISDLLEGEEAVVVFANHREVLAGLEAALTRQGTSFVKLLGETPPAERQRAVDDFQQGKARVFLGSLLAANVGITLTRSSAVVMAESDWVPSNNEQAEGRCYRIGQRVITRVYYLVVPDSLDDAVTSAVLRKQRDIETVMGNGAPQTQGVPYGKTAA